MTVLLTTLLLWIVSLASAANRLNFEQGVLVHLFEWKYDDIALECETFLKNYGFRAVVISPPSENLVYGDRPWWERYQPVSYKLVTRSGDEESLKNMLQRCNNVKIRVIADVVFNQMASKLVPSVGTGGSIFDHHKYEHPDVPYKREDFHSPQCDLKNYYDRDEVRRCGLDGMHDLDQSRPNVREVMVNYLNKLVSIGFAGFRIDAAKHMEPGDLQAILGGVHKLNPDYGFPSDTDPFVFLEVIDYGDEPVTFHEYLDMGLITDFVYGDKLGERFTEYEKYPIKDLRTFGESWNLIPNDKSLVFVNNHDTQRDPRIGKKHLDSKSAEAYKLAVAFMLAWPYGTPILFSSFDFDDFGQGPPSSGHPDYHILSPHPVNNQCEPGWRCEHRWRQVFNMVRFHDVVKGTDFKWSDNLNNQIEFCRGDKGFIVINMEKTELKKKFQTCLPKGDYCDVISGGLDKGKCSGQRVSVDDNGEAEIVVHGYPTNDPHKDAAVALHVEEREDPAYSEIIEKSINFKLDIHYHTATGAITYETKQIDQEGNLGASSGAKLGEKPLHFKTDLFYFPTSDKVEFNLQEVMD